MSVLFLTACSKSGEVDSMSRYGNKIDDFEVINQENETYAEDDMEGEVVLVDFNFTHYTTVCPTMTNNIVSVVQDLEDDGVENFGVLSFSVDPKRDTPEQLQEYIKAYHVDE